MPVLCAAAPVLLGVEGVGVKVKSPAVTKTEITAASSFASESALTPVKVAHVAPLTHK